MLHAEVGTPKIYLQKPLSILSKPSFSEWNHTSLAYSIIGRTRESNRWRSMDGLGWSIDFDFLIKPKIAFFAWLAKVSTAGFREPFVLRIIPRYL